MDARFRVVISLEAVGMDDKPATSTLRRRVEYFSAINSEVEFKDAQATYETLLHALDTLEAFSE